MIDAWAGDLQFPSLSYIVLIFVLTIVVWGIHLILYNIYYNFKDESSRDDGVVGVRDLRNVVDEYDDASDQEKQVLL